jgi:lon-related putative ATP-dependent protease
MTSSRSVLKNKLRLKPHLLRHRIDPKILPSSKQYHRHRTHIIGQDRAIEALELGLRLNSPGYNIFVSGPSGTGRMTTARHILENFKQPRRPLKDYVYVNNFQEPDRPKLLALLPGKGLRLKRAMDHLIKTIKNELPRTIAAENYQKERDRIISDYQQRERGMVSEFQEEVRKIQFTLVEIQGSSGVEHDVVPVINGEPQAMGALEEQVATGKLSKRKHKILEQRHRVLRSKFDVIQRKTRALAKEMSRHLEELDRQIGSKVIDTQIADLRDQFREESVRDYIEEAREALLDLIPALARHAEEECRPNQQEQQGQGEQSLMDPFSLFGVNVVLNNEKRKGCPVVVEQTPTPVRLFGTIERSVDETGHVEADFMNIRAGALLRADGGFLVVNVEDLLVDLLAWKGFKRTLSTGQMEIRLPEGPLAMMTSALKPDPISLDVKAIVLGDEELYRTLYLTEDDFKKTFKVKAEFDVEMDFTTSNLEKFMAFIQRVVKEEKLLQPTRQAIAGLVEEAMRDVEDQYKITTRFRVVADLLRESTYWARKRDRSNVVPEDVKQALEERRKRVNLSEEKYRESIVRDVVMVETTGSRVGQVNGLAVFDLGDYSFGKPCRISASVGVGRAGVVNIERESGLSGEIHDKGVFILSGFLRNRFGQEHPLAVDASVCFEQNYGEIDGDSASSTEVYAILSCLSGLPLNQAIAVTGSVSQQGDIQPIGGINHKIEGFFDICKARGLKGSQGVIIPKGNLPHLMLDREVVSAVKDHKFHVWTVSTVDQGMELLTGVVAGVPDKNGVYPPNTINRRVADAFKKMAATLREYGNL